jgi:Na+-driven multidrug efflux pump
MASIYNKNSEIIELTSRVIRLNGFLIVIWPFSFVLPAGLKGAGDVKYTLVTAVIGMWIFRITLGYILSIILGIGLLGVWIAMYTDWIVRGILYYFRLRGGKWKKKAIVNNQ